MFLHCVYKRTKFMQTKFSTTLRVIRGYEIFDNLADIYSYFYEIYEIFPICIRGQNYTQRTKSAWWHVLVRDQ